MTIVFIMDKPYPSNHSFVDGLVLNKNMEKKRIILFENSSKKVDEFITDYIEVRPKLFPRRKFGRFINLIVIFMQLNSIKREANVTTIFVRNCPIYLLAAKIFKPKHVVYQSSFDHEKDVNFVKAIISKILHLMWRSRVNYISSVSTIALARLKKRYPHATGFVIPLCNELSVPFSDTGKGCKHFVYLGKTSKERRLDVIIDGLSWYILTESISLTIIGDTRRGFARKYPKIKTEILELIAFEPKTTRQRAIEMLPNFDVGISCVPNLSENREMSPTKLSEYVCAGLAILATNNIPMQVDLLSKYKIGVLAEFSKNSIHEAVKNLKTDIDQYKNQSRIASNEFDYRNYFHFITDLE